jgi:hypothetical protein
MRSDPERLRRRGRQNKEKAPRKRLKGTNKQEANVLLAEIRAKTSIKRFSHDNKAKRSTTNSKTRMQREPKNTLQEL